MGELPLLEEVLLAARRYRASLSERPVRAAAGFDELVSALDATGEIPSAGVASARVLEELLARAEPGLTAMNSPRFFGWVVGGTHEACLAADWLTSAWDQNAGTGSGAPAAAAFEAVALGWVRRLLGLPEGCSAALVTGATQATFVGLAAARHELLAARGWDVEQAGLCGAPPLCVLVGQERHEAIDKAVRLLGLGKASMRFLATDAEGRLLPSALRRAFQRTPGPWIVCSQAGNVNSGSFDPAPEISEIISDQRARFGARSVWWHVDGAFGLWAAASSKLRHLTQGVDAADSWATDAHKMLNVPYDCGLGFTRFPHAHRHAFAQSAAYLSSGEDSAPPFSAFTPELSRRARGFTLWAALRALGAEGIDELVNSRHLLAKELARQLACVDGVLVQNQVVFNQVVLGLAQGPARNSGEAEERARALQVCLWLQREGTCYPTPTIWRGKAGLRFSVCNADTTELDIGRSAQAVARALTALRPGWSEAGAAGS